MVNDLVTNGVICSVYFFKDRGCDEMTSIRLQAKLTYDLQAYVDRMYGGPGKGWFRIVTDSAQARRVIEQGKLAVVLGVETSEPFGCKQVLDVPQCDKEDIDKGLDELYALGVRSMFLCHKFDNALCGVRFDSGTLGTAINVGQFLSTGTFWRTERCAGPQADNPIGLAAAPEAEKRLPQGVSVPSYDADARCNVRGLTALGEYAVRGMMQRKMMLEIDHMSVKATGRVLDIFEAESYPGVLSSHSWMDLNWTERVYGLGGFIAQYMHGSEGFSAEAERTDALRDKYGVGYGYGTDMNGVGGWPGPRGADTGNPVRYPFRSADGGSLIDRQTTGERTWDLNTDGAAHYGSSPTGSRTSGWSAARTSSTTCSAAPSPTSTPGAVPNGTARRPTWPRAPVPPPAPQNGGTPSAATRPAGPSTATGTPAGPASGATPSGSASTWAPPTSSAASPSTGSAPTRRRTASNSPQTAGPGGPPGPPRPATADWTPRGSRRFPPVTSASRAWSGAPSGATRSARWASTAADASVRRLRPGSSPVAQEPPGRLPTSTRLERIVFFNCSCLGGRLTPMTAPGTPTTADELREPACG
ncbi:hypothetical protein SGLAM104S_00107 [Streptomyces glaucescens]